MKSTQAQETGPLSSMRASDTSRPFVPVQQAYPAASGFGLSPGLRQVRKTIMADVTIADSLRLAINVLRDSAESRKMQLEIDLDGATAALHADAAESR
ncbi:hypothetical protein ABS381_005870 [Burkholderia multivorans]